MTTPFALWITGLPASGKSTLTAALLTKLRKRSIDPVVLDFDGFRKHFLAATLPSEDDRLRFYRGIVDVAALFLARDIPVIIDATGNRRAYRAAARERLPAFAEVFLDCPLEVCVARDTRGLHPKGAEFEPPLHPELRIRTDREDPQEAARKIVDFLIERGWIPSRKLYKV